MLKKMLPLFLVLGLVLGACGTDNNNGAAPMNNNDQREENWTPNVQDDRQGGTNLDGLDENNRDGTGNGVINDDVNRNNDNMLPNGETQRNNGNGTDSEMNDNSLNNR